MCFFCCSSLTNINIPNSVTSIGESAFSGCSNLTSINIPNSVTNIDNGAFSYCSNLTSINIPNSVTRIGKKTFSHCRGLTSINLPNSVTSIGNAAFCLCYSLKDVYYSGSPEQWKKIKIDSDNDWLTNATIHYNHTGSVLSYTQESFNQAFPDSNVRNGVLAELGMTAENADYSKITSASLAGISKCTIVGAANLTGIELLKGVNSLDIELSTITFIPSSLTQLTNLRQLTLKASDITTLNGLSNLKSLTELDISDCSKLTDVWELSNLTQLENLYADGIGQPDILSAIKAISTLKRVSVLGNGISDITPIVGNSYDYLNIGGNKLEDDVFESDDFKALQSQCGTIIYSPQNIGFIKNIKASGNNVDVTIENDTGTIFENVALYTAVYRENRLVEVKITDIQKLNGDEKLTPSVEFHEIKAGDTVKCFAWTETLQSLTEAKEITVTDISE